MLLSPNAGFFGLAVAWLPATEPPFFGIIITVRQLVFIAIVPLYLFSTHP
jgi:hypothetical protein